MIFMIKHFSKLRYVKLKRLDTFSLSTLLQMFSRQITKED